MRITTTIKGTKVTAKGAGKQRTVDLIPTLSNATNHGLAAGNLASALGHSFQGVTITLHDDNGNARFDLA